MQDSIYYMILNCKFICDFAVKCDFSAISNYNVVKDISAQKYGLCTFNPLVDYQI